MNIELRDYQQEALETILQEHEAGVTRQLVSLPTGSGKTILMAAIAKHFNKKTLLIAHREELITQAVDKFKLYWPTASIGICMGDQDDIDQQIVVGSVQSCSKPRRLERLLEQGFQLMMIDEAHHATSQSYQLIIESLGFNQDESKLLVGVSATIERSDKLPLGTTFQKITYSRSISTMIKAGNLCPVRGRKILTNFTLNDITTSSGDFCLNDLAEAVNTPQRNTFVLEKYLEYAPDRKGIVFCVDVQHCKDMEAAFNSRGIATKAVWGDMPTHDRKNVLNELKTGKIQVVTSCGVLTEGYDETSINCITMARPTKSKTLYVQCVGRGLRLHPGKLDCLVLDFTDKGHNLDSIIALSNTIPEAPIHEEKEQVEREELDRTPKVLTIEDRDEEFDVLGSARFLWTSIGDDEWSLLGDDRNEIVVKPSQNGYIADLYHTNGSIIPIVNKPLPLDYCTGVCEDYGRRHLKIAYADSKSSWFTIKAHPTQSQIDFLKKEKAYKEGMSKSAASVEIRKIVALKNKRRRILASEPITSKQRYLLINSGHNVDNISKYEAMNLIAKLKQKQRVTQQINIVKGINDECRSN